jgi:hypothetical protein
VLRILTMTLASALGAAGPHFATLPTRALQGSKLSVSVQGRGMCTLSVRYSGGFTQRLGSAVASKGIARFDWSVPGDARPGPAAVSVSCAGKRAARTVMVVGAVLAPKIQVAKDGFSIRPMPYSGTNVSYGVLLENVSHGADALKIQALVNMVDASNKAIGSVSSPIDLIPAGSTYALGGNLTFPGAAPVDHLEVVIQVGGHQKPSALLPELANIHPVPSTYDPGWVGGVQGELANTQAGLILQRANLSAVVLDAAGNVLGGGTGFASASLPPGAREFFDMGQGFNAIPLDRAASALVSITPTFSQAGS